MTCLDAFRTSELPVVAELAGMSGLNNLNEILSPGLNRLDDLIPLLMLRKGALDHLRKVLQGL